MKARCRVVADDQNGLFPRRINLRLFPIGRVNLQVQMAEPYRVFVVVDQEYGGRLGELAQTGPVWIVDTPANRTIAQQIWAANPNRSHLNVVTTFKFEEGSSSEDILINELDTIDLHHGTYSANPPYTVLEVIGTGISARLKTELSQFGFGEFQETSEGFRAVRPLIDQRGQNV
jgi:hypothetical protein